MNLHDYVINKEGETCERSASFHIKVKEQVELLRSVWKTGDMSAEDAYVGACLSSKAEEGH